MILTGIVAVLNPALDTVTSVQDLGPQGASVKPGRVLPLVENQPALGADQYYGPVTYTINAGVNVTRNWPVLTDTNQVRKDGLSADSNVIALLTQAQTATTAQIDTWLTNNVTTLAQARTVLGALIKIVAVRVL